MKRHQLFQGDRLCAVLYLKFVQFRECISYWWHAIKLSVCLCVSVCVCSLGSVVLQLASFYCVDIVHSVLSIRLCAVVTLVACDTVGS